MLLIKETANTTFLFDCFKRTVSSLLGVRAVLSYTSNFTRGSCSQTLATIPSHGLASKMFNLGRPRSITSTIDRYLSLCTRRNRTATLSELRSFLAASFGMLVLWSTIRRRLHERGLYVRQPTIYNPFTSGHRRERLIWACQHVHKTRDQWRAGLFTDES
ncbi:transposable element Tcb1 transposase [Trichonephila clavipes]|nr:transposable element Tcb1 transposase [Trichonephila clavipes]